MTIRKMTAADADWVAAMMRVFYASPAVLSDGSEEIFQNDLAACVGDSPFLEGFAFLEDGLPAGYAMAAHSFSTEFGRPCVWIEDLYVAPEYRSRGFGGQFLALIAEKYPQAVLRLEAEPDNAAALRFYRKNGYELLPYAELIRTRGKQ